MTANLERQRPQFIWNAHRIDTNFMLSTLDDICEAGIQIVTSRTHSPMPCIGNAYGK